MDWSDPKLYLNRDLAMLAFQERVLAEAADPRNPLLDRVRSLFYFIKNTDEFFMKRIGLLCEEMEAGIRRKSPDGRTPRRQWRDALRRFGELRRRKTALWNEQMRPALAEAGIRITRVGALPEAARLALRERFESEVLPTLTPLAFDPAHPFPFISNLSVSIGMFVREPARSSRFPADSPTGDAVFTRIKVPPNQDPFWRVLDDDPEAGWTGVPVADVIIANLDLLLPGVEISDISLFRVTRSAAVDPDDLEADDLVGLIQELIERRRRGPFVRIEVEERMPPAMRRLLLERLELDEKAMIVHPSLLEPEALDQIVDLDRSDLKYPEWTPRAHPQLDDTESSEARSLFEAIRQGDVLVHHPYHAFSQTTQRFLDSAADDPDVIGIKIAIYRTANDSAVLDALIRAARNGKQVAVLVELKARFDESQNVRWVRLLEDQGIHVAYGQPDHKTHTKLALVIRRESDGVRLYAHIGTGNYHSVTANAYTDLGLFTADPAIGREVVDVFNIFTGPHRSSRFDHLLIAPLGMRQRFVGCIRHEAQRAASGKSSRIIVKMNAIEDVEIIGELYRAAKAGVPIDLIVRDICRLRPGLGGLTGHTRVHSIVGPFLEHSRIVYFENGGPGRDPIWLLGSADWMKRNLDNRMEAIVPVRTPMLQSEMRVILETTLADNRRRWRMQPDGTYVQCRPAKGMPVLDSQQILKERAAAGEFGQHGARRDDILRRQPGPRPRTANATQ